MASPSAISISLSKFTEAVQAAVKSAVAKHPKFKIETPNAVMISYLIRGIPVPESLLAAATLAEAQAFANDVAAHVGTAFPQLFSSAGGGSSEGAMLSIGRHIILGIPPVAQMIRLEK